MTSKVLDYFREEDRMCDNYDDDCNDCKSSELHLCGDSDITQKCIDIVQEWSNEHLDNIIK